MNPLDRISLASRVFLLTATLLLSALSRDLGAAQYAILLMTVGLLMWWLARAVFLNHAWVAAAEGLFSAFLIGLTAAEHPQLLPYLLAPPLVAGLAGGVFPLLTAVSAQSVGTVLLTSDAVTTTDILERAEFFAPWLVISLGIGLLGAWLREIGLGPDTPSLDRSYESARRLIGQLRSVARRLSSGLDPVTIASGLQTLIVDRTDASRLAVFVSRDGGLLAPLTYFGPGARETLLHDDELVMRCWEEAEPVSARLPKEASHRVALPLRVGPRMIGVVLAETSLLDDAVVQSTMREVDDAALRLETALVFDEVRSLATMEERRRLGREIHDGVAQEIASLGYLIDDLAAELPQEQTAEKVAELRQEISRIVNELRLSIFDLRSSVGAETTLGTSLSDYVQRVGAKSDMTVHLTLDESPARLRTEVEAELLRIVQEAVTNARKHAQAANLWVDCRIRAPWAHISIRDDGRGLGSAREDSFGLRIMQERATRIGARLHVTTHSPQHGGTEVTVTLGTDVLPERHHSAGQSHSPTR